MSPSIPQIVALSLIQGAAEPLPVSSSAHVIVAERIMHLDPSSPEMTFLLAMLHTGTMAAVIAYFWRSWSLTFLAGPAQLGAAAARVGLATAVTLAVYFALEQVIKRVAFHGRPGAEVEDLFSNLPLMAAALAAGGALIIVAGLSRGGVPGGAAEPRGDLSGRAALWVGAVQGVVLPFRGLSRSGATISAGMLLGVPRRLSEEFSFALAVVITPPVILRELLRFYRAQAAAPDAARLASLAAPGLLGMACSFGAGLVALRWLTGWLDRGRWHYFGIYCLAAAAGVLVLSRGGL